MSERLYVGTKAGIQYAGYFLIGGLVVVIGIAVMASVSLSTGMFVLGVGWVFIVIPMLIVRTTEYVVTTDRAAEASGILSRKTSEIELADVRNVQVTQSLSDRMLGIGNVGISTAGQSGFEVVFKGVKSPNDVADIVRRARERLRENTG